MFRKTKASIVAVKAISLLSVALQHGLVLSVSHLCLVGPAIAQDVHLGQTEYEIACMPCHGPDGRGDGVLAGKLPTKPSDLTRITKSNGGKFPAKRIAGIIDGRASSEAHRRRSMPVWGERYRHRADPNESSSTIERRARKRIEALVHYVESLQQQ